MLDNENNPMTSTYTFVLPVVEPHPLAVQREKEKANAIERVNELMALIPTLENHEERELLQKEQRAILQAWAWTIVDGSLVTYDIPYEVSTKIFDK